jgi:2',3'-cyclic-nucleotide 2'-phosphodiesterase (5'-nucleotidase family)
VAFLNLVKGYFKSMRNFLILCATSVALAGCLNDDDEPLNIGVLLVSSVGGGSYSANEAAALAVVKQAKPGIAALISEEQALGHFAQTLVDRDIALTPPTSAAGRAVTLTLLHTNDTHSRIESFTDTVLQGGVARRMTLIDQVRAEVGADKVLLLDAGDYFQGTIFFNVWEGSESIMAMNDMQYDAATLGNHEFDLGPAKLARALKGENISIAGTRYVTEAANFPVVATNLDVGAESSLKGLLQKYAVIERDGEKYGVLGIVTADLPVISNLGDKAKMLDYVKSVNAASALLKSLGINKIILLSHYGYGVDITKANQLSGVDIIVSSHDHVLLGDADYINTRTADAGLSYPGQGALSRGAYPNQLANKEGDPLLVVSAYEWGRWLGRLEVSFDAQGRIVGSNNKSMFVDGRTVTEDVALAAKVAEYKTPVATFSNVLVGSSSMNFSAARGTTSPFVAGVRTGETVLGNLIMDLMQIATATSDNAVAAFSNGGGLRADILQGEVTFGQALSVLPFGNTLYVMDLSGQDVIDLMEASAGKVGGGGFLQHSSNLRMRYCALAQGCVNPLKAGGKVTSILIAGQPVDPSKTYRLATNNFTAGGGDGYDLLKAACQRPGNFCRDTGIVLLDLLVDRLKTGTPLSASLDGRIERVGE